jgi:acetyltransferase-like isoleucine patch superfamily enzyme
MALVHKPFMVYGYIDPQTQEFRKWTRISSTTTIVGRNKLSIGDHVWVWHNSVLDASGGLTIGEGCQIGAGVYIFTHGSNNAIRLLGKDFIHFPNTERTGYVRAAVEIGPYTFISSGSVVLPGIKIGRGCVIGPNSLVAKNVADYSVLMSPPARIVGDTLSLDSDLLAKEDFSATYYAPDLLPELRKTCSSNPGSTENK